MAMDCHLLVPELFLPESTGAALYDELALPALETLLARGTLARSAGISLERWLAAAFRVVPQYDLPLAAASLRGDGVDPGDAAWLQADPVHLKVQHDQLVLADASSFEITAQEAAGMLGTLNAHFLENGVEFIAPVPQRWYARVGTDPRIRTTPTLEVAGRSIEEFLPAGDDGARWRRLSNEVQMLLHEHPCNEAREIRGEIPVNSVWFWGSGRMPEIGAAAPYDAVWTDNPLAAGLARIAGVRAGALPPSGAALLETSRDAVAGRPGLVVLDRLRGTSFTDLHAWRAALADLEARWFAPALEGLRRGALRCVTLHALGPDFSLAASATRADLFKFWRLRRPLANYLKAVSA
jgi:hypothetical protein